MGIKDFQLQASIDVGARHVHAQFSHVLLDLLRLYAFIPAKALVSLLCAVAIGFHKALNDLRVALLCLGFPDWPCRLLHDLLIRLATASAGAISSALLSTAPTLLA